MLMTHLDPIQQEGFIIGDTEPIYRMSYRRRMDRIQATIDLHGATAHIHSYLTYAASLGTDVKTLQSIAGHADIQTAMCTHRPRTSLKLETVFRRSSNRFCAWKKAQKKALKPL